MIKTTILVLAILFSFGTVTPLYAQDNPAPTEADSNAIQKKIDDLKERLATRVAELKSQNKKAFYGVIKQKDDTNILLASGDVELSVDFDSTAKIEVKTTAGKKSAGTAQMLTVGSHVAAFGTLDLDQKKLSAKYLLLHEQPIVTVGTVTSVDIKEGTFVIESTDGTMTLDYEIGTKCRMYDGETLISCGLSKIKSTDRIIIRMIPDQSDQTRAAALRILLLPTQAAPDDTTATPTQTALTPARSVTPTARPTQ